MKDLLVSSDALSPLLASLPLGLAFDRPAPRLPGASLGVHLVDLQQQSKCLTARKLTPGKHQKSAESEGSEHGVTKMRMEQIFFVKTGARVSNPSDSGL